MKKNGAKADVQRVRVESTDAGRRLDNFLLGRLRGVPRARVYRMIRAGEVRVNGGRAKPDRRLAAGDEVRIPPLHVPSARGARPSRAQLRSLEARIVYEDAELLVLNKPSGVAAHGGSGISHGAIERLRASRPRQTLELVHRLDRDTSGCLLVAKKRSALRRLHDQFRAGDVDKHYLALLIGKWSGGDRGVYEPLKTTHRRGGERHVRVDPGGKPADTRFIPERRFPEATLVRAILGTGRTHQIRVHAAHIGMPVAGDTRYGADPDLICEHFGLSRLFLHAATLAFEIPGSEHIIRVDSPLDDDLEAVLTQLGKDVTAA